MWLDRNPHVQDRWAMAFCQCDAYLSDDRLLVVGRDGAGHEYAYREFRYHYERARARGIAQMRGDYVDPLWVGIERSDAGMAVCARGLAAALGLEPQVLDGGRASLAVVDRALGRLPRPSWSEPALFAPLAAYAGEVVRRQLDDGHWDFDRSGWPSVMDRHGRCFALVKLFEEVTETRGRTPTQLFVTAVLGSIGLASSR